MPLEYNSTFWPKPMVYKVEPGVCPPSSNTAKPENSAGSKAAHMRTRVKIVKVLITHRNHY